MDVSLLVIRPGKTKSKFRHLHRAGLYIAPPTHTHTLCSSMLTSFIQSIHWTLTHAGSALAAAVQVLSHLRETGRVWMCLNVCLCAWDSRSGTKCNRADGNRPMTRSTSVSMQRLSFSLFLSLSLCSALFMFKHFIGLHCWCELLHPLLLLKVLWYFLTHQRIYFVVIFVMPCTISCVRFFRVTHFTFLGDWFLMCFSLESLYVDGSLRIHNILIKTVFKMMVW